MPLYEYEHPENGQRILVVQGMNDAHEYSENGIKWKRVFDVPHARIDSLSNLDPFSKQAFKDRVGKMGHVTQGDLWDLSAELSQKRAKKLGKDPVKEKAEADYKNKTGKDHPHKPIESKNFEVK